MSFIPFFIIIIAAVIVSLLLKKHDGVYPMMVAVFASSVILIQVLMEFENISVKLYNFTLSSDIFEIPLKALGITVFSKITASICDDAGEKLLSFTSSLINKISILILCLPLIEEILKILDEFIK